MKYSLSISFLAVFCLLTACKSAYSGLKPAESAQSCELHYKPLITETIRYTTRVQAFKYDFSGILLFKKMEDASLRIVFTNQFGVKFFDFGFNEDGSFVKHYVLPQMDKEPVVNLLRKDFEMLLMQYDPKKAEILSDGVFTYTSFALKKGKVYYVTSPDCEKLIKIENGSKRKPVIQIFLSGEQNLMPDTFLIEHKKVPFTIQSKKISP